MLEIQEQFFQEEARQGKWPQIMNPTLNEAA
jgi:hypothetical protein